MLWPAVPVVEHARILALQYQLERTQWWSRETLVRHQHRQLERLVRHAARTVPFYRDRLAVIGGTGESGFSAGPLA